MKVWLVQAIRLCKAIELLCKITKLFKAVKLLYKLTKSCNTTDDKGFDAKLWQLCVDRIPYDSKFQNVALSIIGYEENYLH